MRVKKSRYLERELRYGRVEHGERQHGERADGGLHTGSVLFPLRVRPVRRAFALMVKDITNRHSFRAAPCSGPRPVCHTLSAPSNRRNPPRVRPEAGLGWATLPPRAPTAVCGRGMRRPGLTARAPCAIVEWAVSRGPCSNRGEHYETDHANRVRLDGVVRTRRLRRRCHIRP